MPIVVSHGEGRVCYHTKEDKDVLAKNKQFGMRYIDAHSKPTEFYPLNPNGSEGGLTAFASQDGRATIMMPHPERSFRLTQLSWYPYKWRKKSSGFSPWMRLFRNARKWIN